MSDFIQVSTTVANRQDAGRIAGLALWLPRIFGYIQ
jgi:hypothetical protein